MNLRPNLGGITTAALATCLLLPTLAEAANVSWDGGGTTNNWTEGANWAGGTAPGSGDTAVFDGTSTKNATVNAGISAGGIDINTGYTGTITQGSGNAITIGSSGFDQAAGTFTGGTSTIDVNGSFTLSGGTFNHNGGDINFDGGAASIDVSGSLTLRHVNWRSGVKTIADNDTLIVTGNLSLAGGKINQITVPGAGTVAARGGQVKQFSGFDGGTGTLVIDGTGNQTFFGEATATNGDFPDLRIIK